MRSSWFSWFHRFEGFQGFPRFYLNLWNLLEPLEPLEPLLSLFAIIQPALNASAGRFDLFRLADEEIVGELAVSQNLGIDRAALVEVEAEAGQILQAQVAVAVDVRVLEPLFQVDRAAAVAGEHVDR